MVIFWRIKKNIKRKKKIYVYTDNNNHNDNKQTVLLGAMENVLRYIGNRNNYNLTFVSYGCRMKLKERIYVTNPR